MLEGLQRRPCPAMGIVTARAVGLCHIETAVLRFQNLCVMTLPAKFRSGLSEQFPIIGAVRIMAHTASSLRNRFMEGRP